MRKIRVLFVCVHNSARSQMAEAFLRNIGGDRFEAESAGLEPGMLNPVAVAVMKEVGIDISENKTKSVFDLAGRGRAYDRVITVCDGSESGKCPVFPGCGRMIHWAFEDPSGFKGKRADKLARTRLIRDRIRAAIEGLVNDEIAAAKIRPDH